MSCIVGNIFNILVNPIALDAIGWKYYIVYIALLLVYGTVVFFFYPETKGLSLEQMASIFDEDRVIDSQPVYSMSDIPKTAMEKKD